MNAAPPKLEVVRVSKEFRQEGRSPVVALDEFSFNIRPGEFVSVVGPSGCGKSTLFNIISGLETPTSGRVVFEGRDIGGQRGIVGYQLQKDLLLPWRTALDNVILGMEIKRLPKDEARRRAREAMARYGLAGFEHHYPDALSGGMRQRVALMRTLLYDRDLILLDEPFGALDAQTRLLMQEWLLQVWDEFRKTILFVTHDVEEALFLSDRVLIMSARPGRLKIEVSVNLPRPRTYEVVLQPGFLEQKRQLLAGIREESLRAFAEQPGVGNG